MVYYKTKEEIELVRKSSELVSATLAEVANFLKEGVTTLQVDELAEKVIRDHGAVPSFKNYKGFPFTCCISVNDAVVHGFPNSTPLKSGDIVSVDVGAYWNSFHGDSAYTFAIGEIPNDVKQLLRVTKESLEKGVAKAIVGNRVGDISYAVQEYTERQFGYGVVRELVGHGLGRSLHEDPQVPNYGKRGTGLKLKEGLVIAVEPMITQGKRDIFYDDDGWTVRTKDGKPAAHYEYTLSIQKGKADILSPFTKIEANEKANPNLDTSY